MWILGTEKETSKDLVDLEIDLRKGLISKIKKLAEKRKDRMKVKCSRMTHLQMGEEKPSHISKVSDDPNNMQICLMF